MSSTPIAPSRRAFLAGGASLAALTLAGCADVAPARPDRPARSSPTITSICTGRCRTSGSPYRRSTSTSSIRNMFRAQVADPTGERPGTIVVNTSERHLYLVPEGGQAIRYGVGIGREDLRGRARPRSGRKAEWPTLDADQGNDGAPARDARIRQRHAAGSHQSARGAGALYLSGRARHAVSPAWHAWKCGRSGGPFRAAACGCCSTTSSISTAARRWERRSSSTPAPELLPRCARLSFHEKED